MITRRSLGKQAAAGAAAALGMVGAAGAVMATSGQVSGVSGGFTVTLPPSLVEDLATKIQQASTLQLNGKTVVAFVKDVVEAALRDVNDPMKPVEVRIAAVELLLNAAYDT